MKVMASELAELATAALVARGVPGGVAAAMASEAVAAEAAGRRTHGMAKLLSLNLGDPSASPTVNRLGPLVIVNGNGGNGFATMRHTAEVVTEVAAEFGVAVGLARNFSRYSSLRPYTEIVAEAGYIGILMNGAGPAAVAPFGSADPITGTNPICFSFPTRNGVRTFDLSTAKVVWGEIRQAALEERPLPGETFLDAQGEFTTTPAEVNAVLPFGGAKGSALNLAIEILAGPLAGAKAGLEVNTEFDLGALIVAIDPRRTTDVDEFALAVTRLFGEIAQSRPLEPGAPVRVPGEGRPPAIADGHEIEVRDNILDGLKAMRDGRWSAELAANPLFN